MKKKNFKIERIDNKYYLYRKTTLREKYFVLTEYIFEGTDIFWLALMFAIPTLGLLPLIFIFQCDFSEENLKIFNWVQIIKETSDGRKLDYFSSEEEVIEAKTRLEKKTFYL